MTAHRSLVSTHVLDSTSGRPAAGLALSLERVGDGTDPVVATGTTDDDGRVGDLGPEALAPGTYLIRFGTGAWFARTGTPTFYPEVVVAFEVTPEDAHLHVPLLLSPFAYSTYRGS